MLVLKRCKNQKVLFPSLGISVQVVGVSGKYARLGIDAPVDVRIVRDEMDQMPDVTIDAGPEPTLKPNSSDCLTDEGCLPIELCDSVEICDSIEDFRCNVDAANLAIYLARNQLQQGLIERANEALGHALGCLQSLEQSIASSGIPTFHEPETVVRESTPTWLNSAKQTAMVAGGISDQRDEVCQLLKSLGFRTIEVPDGISVVKKLREVQQPELVLLLNDEAANGGVPEPERRELVQIPGIFGLGQNLSTIQLAGQTMIAWSSRQFDVNSLSSLVKC